MKVLLENISIVFDETFLLKQKNFCLEDKAFVCIQGNNGVGKTTLIKIMSGIKHADIGHVKYFENDIEIEKKIFQKNLGLVLGQKFLCLEMTLEENLHLYYPQFKEDAHVDHLLSQFSLKPKLKQVLSSFSKGEIQKTALCRALLYNPETIFFDEPFEGLDQQTQAFLVNYIQQHLHQKTMLLCSHVDAFLKEDFDDCWDLNLK